LHAAKSRAETKNIIKPFLSLNTLSMTIKKHAFVKFGRGRR